MKKVSIPYPAPCEACGSTDQTMTVSRDKGLGAELLVVCLSCGNEVHGEMNEELAKKFGTFAAAQERSKLQ